MFSERFLVFRRLLLQRFYSFVFSQKNQNKINGLVSRMRNGEAASIIEFNSLFSDKTFLFPMWALIEIPRKHFQYFIEYSK